jgi:glycosyltransferase involved in cell wall biosynthesis
MVVTSRRALGTHQDRNRIWVVSDRIANWLSDFVVTNSKAVAADTVSRDHVKMRKLRSIYNGIDIAPIAAAAPRRDVVRADMGLVPEAIVIVCIANLIAYKGHEDLLSAFAAVSNHGLVSNRPMMLLLAGEDRGIGENLARRASDLGILDKVRFLGGRRDIPNILAAADMGVLPSHEEGFSNALLEMLSAGIPVVATDVGGNGEALAGMEGCSLVPPSDPIALASAVRNIVAGLPERPERSVLRVAQIKSRFSVGAMVDQYEKLYRQFH